MEYISRLGGLEHDKVCKILGIDAYHLDNRLSNFTTKLQLHKNLFGNSYSNAYFYYCDVTVEYKGHFSVVSVPPLPYKVRYKTLFTSGYTYEDNHSEREQYFLDAIKHLKIDIDNILYNSLKTPEDALYRTIT